MMMKLSHFCVACSTGVGGEKKGCAEGSGICRWRFDRREDGALTTGHARRQTRRTTGRGKRGGAMGRDGNWSLSVLRERRAGR